MSTYAVAQQKQERIKPAFMVEKLEGTRTELRHMFHPKERKIVMKEVDVPAGYFVKFAKGHSLRVDEAGLQRIMNGNDTIELIDTKTDEVVGTIAVNL